ncbi:histidine phosphatase family protein [Streptomyces sp. NPDC058195]|uniref:histidine phosphatase family protein n=1 Tax=Streptomyces sp. NPDC058195 TaxID=3346375 RepID=UPI0036F14DA7
MTATSPPTGELTVIRHGQTAWSGSVRPAGRTGVPLADAGEAAAGALAPKLAHRRLGGVFSSPLIRATRTAEPAGRLRPERPVARSAARRYI